MIKANFIIYCCLAGGLWLNSAAAAGLDEIYRDLVRSDNRGYLPLFVKNRDVPSLDNGISITEVETDETVSSVSEELAAVRLDNERVRREEEKKAAELRWKQVLQNVQNGYVSSFELDELNIYEQQNDPHAVEVLAWIYSRGIGVEPDLIKAFGFYKKAASLQVPEAKENAVKVYRAMTPAQKAELVK